MGWQKNEKNNFVYRQTALYLQTQMREHSSAGSEHLPYKQRVTGSNPVAPTRTPAL